jgi:myo-inositol catabolism protein IolS
MKTTRLGRTNVNVPAVSLGTWGHGGPNVNNGAAVGWSGHDDALAIEALVSAYEAGITHWDTADVYGNGHAETLIGSVWDRVPRTGIFLATKFGWDKGPYDHFYEPAHMRTNLDRSLRNLRTDVIDLYYLHHCRFGRDGRWFEPALEQARRFRDEGKVRFIGLSDWEERNIMRYADRFDPDVVQPYRNVVDDEYESSGLRAWVEEHDAGVAFFSPLKHGLLLGKYDEAVEFPDDDFRSTIPEFGDPGAIARMKRAARAMREGFGRRDEPVLHAVVGALLTGVANATVLLGQRNRSQVEAASRIGEPLSPEEAAWVRSVYRGEAAPDASP